MRIQDLQEVSDLAEGERAAPEPGVTYRLRPVDIREHEPGAVEHVYRQGDVLYARMTTGGCFAVTGANAHVLIPLRTDS